MDGGHGVDGVEEKHLRAFSAKLSATFSASEYSKVVIVNIVRK